MNCITKKMKYKAEFTLGAVLGYIGFLAVIITLGVLATSGVQVISNYMSQRAELASLKDSIVMYRVQSLTNMPPATLDELYNDPSIAAANSKTGTPIPRLLEVNERWNNNGVCDLWGNDYEYVVNSDGTGSITCTSGIIDMSVDF